MSIKRGWLAAFSSPAPCDWCPSRGDEVFVPVREMEAVAVVLWCQHGIAKVRWSMGGKRWERQFLVSDIRPRPLVPVPPRRPLYRAPTAREAGVLAAVLHRGGDKSPVGAEMLVSIGLFNSGRGAKLFLDRLAAYFGWLERPVGYSAFWLITQTGVAALAEFNGGGDGV